MSNFNAQKYVTEQELHKQDPRYKAKSAKHLGGEVPEIVIEVSALKTFLNLFFLPQYLILNKFLPFIIPVIGKRLFFLGFLCLFVLFCWFTIHYFVTVIVLSLGFIHFVSEYGLLGALGKYFIIFIPEQARDLPFFGFNWKTMDGDLILAYLQAFFMNPIVWTVFFYWLFKYFVPALYGLFTDFVSDGAKNVIEKLRNPEKPFLSNVIVYYAPVGVRHCDLNSSYCHGDDFSAWSYSPIVAHAQFLLQKYAGLYFCVRFRYHKKCIVCINKAVKQYIENEKELRS